MGARKAKSAFLSRSKSVRLRLGDTIMNTAEGEGRSVTDLLLNSPLMESLKSIETLLGDGSVGPEALRVPFSDPADAKYQNEGRLVASTPSTLNDTQSTVYAFTPLVKDILDIESVDILAADSLPTNDYTKNAFRNSFHYDRATNQLYIRKDRLSNVGDYLFILIHTSAHIKVNDFVDDSKPMFVAELYRSMRTVMEELFLVRSKLNVQQTAEALVHRKLDILYGAPLTSDEKSALL
eukprot:GFYU01001799.1.p2 GENE.GFYU01001799.1~~GFYU01001799.1.p2  ORF type:complete len:237 (-),score=95.75 GFYU01001799.1:1049-1759(-)